MPFDETARAEPDESRSIFWNLYIGIVYGILYLCFVAYPIVFRQERGWSAGIAGLAFLGIGLGNLVCIFGEPVLRKLIKRHRVDPETGKVRPEAMVSVVCIGAVLLAAGELMFAWTCTPNVHWIWPLIAGSEWTMRCCLQACKSGTDVT